MTFTLSKEDHQKINIWLEEIKKEACEKSVSPFVKDVPYYGPIGGGLTYSFTPTSIGMGITIKESLTGKELDLTDYESW